jgi:hypothetical protein
VGRGRNLGGGGSGRRRGRSGGARSKGCMGWSGGSILAGGVCRGW